MNLLRIGWEISTVGSSCVGTTTLTPLIFQCRDISKSFFKNTSIKCPTNRNIARTRRRLNNTRPMHNAQAPIPTDISPKLSNKEIKEIQHIVGSILYYAWAVDITVLMALSSIASQQTQGTTNTMAKAKQLLDCFATHPDATIQFTVSDMVLNVHLDTSYLSETNAHSRVCGHFFMGWTPKDGDPIKSNGAFFYIVYHPLFCCGFGSRGRTQHSLPQSQRRDNFLTHPSRTRASPAEDIGALQQCHYCWHRKQHRKMATIAIIGNEIFLSRW